MQVDGTVMNIFVISKHVDSLYDGYTKVLKGIIQIINLINTGTVRKKPRMICGCIHSTLFLIALIHWRFIEQMKYTCNGTTIDLVME